MAVIYLSGPTSYAILPAYSPISIVAEDDGTSGTGGVPPIVYCDIYFNGTFYKTISSTSPALTLGVTSLWLFDVSGVAREFLTTKIPDITENDLQVVYTPGITTSAIDGGTTCYVKVRNSTQDSYGVVTPSGTVPVQATFDTAAVAGSGYASNTFFVLNGALQITDSQGLQPYLNEFRVTGSFDVSESVNASYLVYQLSYASKLKVYTNDYGLMPLITANNAFLGSSSLMCAIKVKGYNAAGVVVYEDQTAAVYPMQSNSIYYLPFGIQNIQSILPSIIPNIPLIAYYRVGLVDLAHTATWVHSTPKIFLSQLDGVMQGYYPMMPIAAPKHTRIYFQNYLGHFDILNFIQREESVKVSSSPTEMPVTAVPNGYLRSLPSRSRNNVRSSDFSAVTILLCESDMPFMKQLVASSKAFIEYISPEGIGDPPVALMLPIVILDADIDTLTFEGRYEYEMTLKYVLSYENKIVRN
jgi:hypothetical protein